MVEAHYIEAYAPYPSGRDILLWAAKKEHNYLGCYLFYGLLKNKVTSMGEEHFNIVTVF